jgi:hypothetical protein
MGRYLCNLSQVGSFVLSVCAPNLLGIFALELSGVRRVARPALRECH